jgi:hypothetical protein
MTERKRMPAVSSGDATVMRPFAIYILGAGFSKPAGLPLATEYGAKFIAVPPS